MLRTIVLLMFAILVGGQSAQAQGTFEARQGRAFAQRLCSGCHGIVLGAPSLAAGAPNFYTGTTNFRENIVRAGINYHFGGPAVVAKY